MLKNHDFLPWLNFVTLSHVIGERMEVTSMICIDPHSVYHFEYLLFLFSPDLTTEVNFFDDLNKNRHFC